jgi:hypothetical protein
VALWTEAKTNNVATSVLQKNQLMSKIASFFGIGTKS